MSELEKKLHQGKFEESDLNAGILQLQKVVESLEEEVKHHRELRQNLNSKINPLKVHKNYKIYFYSFYINTYNFVCRKI